MGIALTNIEALQSRINANASGVGELTPLLFQCLSSATIQLVEKLETKPFDAAVAVVEDFVIPTLYPLVDNRFIRFRLNHGLLDVATNAVSVVYGVTEEDLTTATPVVAKFLRVDLEKGLVLFDNLGFSDDLVSIHRRITPDDRFSGYIFRITYDHGFDTSTKSYGKVYKSVPDWLVESSLIKAREIYQLTVPSMDKSASDISMNLEDMIGGKIRFYPTALRPLLS